MKLYSIKRKFCMLDSHNFLLCSFCCDSQTVWERLSPKQQRMISGGLKRTRKTYKNAFSFMVDRGGLTMHKVLGTNNFSSKDCAYALVPQADSEDGETDPKMVNYFPTDTCLSGCTWTRRNTDAIRAKDFYPRKVYFVVSPYNHAST